MSANVEMPFPSGKFRGKAVEGVPTGYLRWAAENWQERTEKDRELMRAINAELEFRERHGE